MECVAGIAGAPASRAKCMCNRKLVFERKITVRLSRRATDSCTLPKQINRLIRQWLTKVVNQPPLECYRAVANRVGQRVQRNTAQAEQCQRQRDPLLGEGRIIGVVGVENNQHRVVAGR